MKLDAAYALNDGSASVRAIDLQNLVDEAKDYAALAYPGLDALNTAITAAEAAIAGNNVTEEDIDDLKTAVRMYRFTQPASVQLLQTSLLLLRTRASKEPLAENLIPTA